MKKRLVKKWIKRYLHPITSGMPHTDRRNENYFSVSIINGEVIPEGCVYTVEHNPMIAIKKQSDGLRRFLGTVGDRKVFVRSDHESAIRSNQPYHMGPEHYRKNPKLKFYGVRVRLMVEEKRETVGIEIGYS